MGLLSRLFGGGQRCAACNKQLRKFPARGGRFSGTMGQLLATPKMEPDHGFVCDACTAIICPVCSGKRSSELGTRQFVCTECGHSPLATIYR